MKKLVAPLAFGLALSFAAGAQPILETNPKGRLFMARGLARPSGGGKSNGITYHNGAVIPVAHVVAIYWGPSWSTGGSDSSIATTLTGFISNFGTTSEYNTITQYYEAGPVYIQKTSLGNTTFFDTSTPPTNVTDADVQGEVAKYLSSHGPADPSTIYEVFLPAGSYSSYGSSDSCGGPNLQYCAYHSNFSYNGVDVKYSSMPYPSCGGCQNAGWTTAQNFEMFIGHETREAVTDPDGNAWYDRRGYEADDKCAWTNLFTDGGYAYQPEWSNAAGGCVTMTR